MDIDPKSFSIGIAGEVSSTYGMKITANDYNTAVAGLGHGVSTIPYQIIQHKPEKPFVVIDGVVYINAKLIKENTL